jgi:hypothetical protein
MFAQKLKAFGFEHEFRPSNAIYANCNDVAQVEHGSFHIIENQTTGKFIIFDYGDFAQCSLKFAHFENLERAYLGQYNLSYLQKHLNDLTKFSPGFYPETNWGGVDKLYSKRGYHSLMDSRLCFSGDLYGNEREFIRLLAQKHPQNVDIKTQRLPYEQYIEFYRNHRIALCSSAGYSGGDICLRDIEMFGLGIPVIRLQYKTKLHDLLMPNKHYISVSLDVDPIRNSIIDHNEAADLIYKRYCEVVDDIEYLQYVERHAREWYERNVLEDGFFKNFFEMIDFL